MLAEMAQWMVDTIFEFGYFGIFALMTIESSFIPFPSEIVLIPAGYLASQGEMSFSMVFLMALSGSMVGAFINYFGAMLIGRALLERYGKYFFIKPEAIHKMDSYFERHGHISTFTGRLIPGIRQLISIPAGISKMDLKVFSFYTALGAGLWSLILIILGYVIGNNEELIKSYLSQITIVALFSVVLIGLIYMYIQKKKAL
ncbi:MAG: DedA family protein [Campylobacterota bacterium]|nr:DedA family protein [Campylobacterota bacterium]